MLVCITGATGFVGSHLVRALLADGHRVRALYRNAKKLAVLDGLEYEAIEGDVTNLESLQAAFRGCDWVFHVAAVADYWNADQEWMFTVNLGGTRNVLQAARDASVDRVIFTSSAGALGLPENGEASDETAHFNLLPAQFPYGYSKVLAEEAVLEAVTRYDQDVVILNPTIIIGPGDLNEISGSFIVQGSKWQWLTPISGGGLSVIDVRDVAAAHLAAARKGRKGERYLLTTANYENTEWFGMIADVLGVAPPLFKMPDWVVPLLARFVGLLRWLRIPVPVDANQVRLATRKIYFDGSKAHVELYQPQIELRQSLQDTYQWYRANGMIRETLVTRLLATLSQLWHRPTKQGSI